MKDDPNYILWNVHDFPGGVIESVRKADNRRANGEELPLYEYGECGPDNVYSYTVVISISDAMVPELPGLKTVVQLDDKSADEASGSGFSVTANINAEDVWKGINAELLDEPNKERTGVILRFSMLPWLGY